jgi:hypothetical protein
MTSHMTNRMTDLKIARQEPGGLTGHSSPCLAYIIAVVASAGPTKAAPDTNQTNTTVSHETAPTGSSFTQLLRLWPE